MALLEILLEGDPRLRQKALRIRNVDDTLRRLAEDMYETMLAAPGVGLAAPQVGILRRLIWVHVPENVHDEGGPELSIPLVNPEIVKEHVTGSDKTAQGWLKTHAAESGWYTLKDWDVGSGWTARSATAI